MSEKTTLTKKQIEDVIESHLLKHKKLPTAKELADKIGGTGQQAQAHLMQASKAMIKMHVLPNGKLYTSEGEMIWYRNSRGSLVQACFRDMGDLGKVIDG